MKGVVVAAMLAAVMPGAALAQDRTGYQAIVAGDLAKAEDRLQRERRIFPDRPELMLNLAAVFRQTGRTDDARALYRRVLDHPAVMMDLPGGTVRSSHAIAATAIDRLAPTVAAR